MNEIDIAAFAQGILEEDSQKGTPVQFAAAQSSQAPDVSEVVVSDAFADQMVSEGLWSKAGIIVEERAPKPKKSVPKQQLQVPLTEETVYKQHLIKEYEKKVADLKELVVLMESFGMVGGDAGGVNTVGRNGGGGSQKRNRPGKKSGRTTRDTRRS